jgi:hypothetical protein
MNGMVADDTHNIERLLNLDRKAVLDETADGSFPQESTPIAGDRPPRHHVESSR